MVKQFCFNGVIINYGVDKDGLSLWVNDINKVLNNCLGMTDRFINFKNLPQHLDLSNVINVNFLNTARGMIVEYVYIMSTDVEGVYKIGYSKNEVESRVKSLQTGSINEIKVLDFYATINGKLLESVVHHQLSYFRVNKREFFKCDLDYIKKTIEKAAQFINLNIDVSGGAQDSSNAVPMEGVQESYNSVQAPETRVPESYNSVPGSEESRFMDWLQNNVVYEEDKILRLPNITKLYFKRDVSTKVAAIYKKLVCKHLAERFPSMDTMHKDTSFRGKNFKGWLHFNICD